MLHRHDRDADIDIGAAGPQPRGAILRQAAFGDIEIGDDLDAGNHGLRQHVGRRGDRPQQAVDAHPHHEPGLKRLDVDVAGAQFDRFFEQIVDGADHRRAACEIAQALDIVVAQLGRTGSARLGLVLVQPLIEHDREILRCRDLDRNVRTQHDLRCTLRRIDRSDRQQQARRALR